MHEWGPITTCFPLLPFTRDWNGVKQPESKKVIGSINGQHVRAINAVA